MMPAFTKFSPKELKAIAGFLYGDEEHEPGVEKEPGFKIQAKKENNVSHLSDSNMPYSISGYSKFLDKNGYLQLASPGHIERYQYEYR